MKNITQFKKIALSFVLVAIVGGGVVPVSTKAGTVAFDSIRLERGWNIVSSFTAYAWVASGGYDDIFSNASNYGIEAAYMYNPFDNEYVRIYPQFEEDKYETYARRLENTYSSGLSALLHSSIWVYSNKTQTFNIEPVTDSDIPLSPNGVELRSGWNFIGINSAFLTKSLSGLRGNCTMQRAYMFNADTQSWRTIDITNYQFNSSDLWQGAIVNVNNNCSLGSVVPSPPSLP